MNPMNVTRDITAPFAMRVAAPFLRVQATAEIITTRRRCVGIGDVIVIDPTQSPDDDQMVLVGNSIQPFTGQQNDGVVIGFHSDVV